MHLLIVMFLNGTLTKQYSLIDKNIAGADGDMATGRGIIGYFSGSTQSTGTLIGAQECGILTVYRDHTRLVKTIQDIITMWWLTW